jgi:hypothetical protein
MFIVDCLGLVVTVCVLKSIKWSLVVVWCFGFFITWSLKMKDEARRQTNFDLLMDDGRVTLELYLLASNIKKKVVAILDFFLTFL